MKKKAMEQLDYSRQEDDLSGLDIDAGERMVVYHTHIHTEC
jgi:hypothetical protein